jgi:DNA segregation ATPase FtsK/SpoIIIE, S-DNA-T family
MGITREHIPTVAEPLIVVLVDELAALTAYAARDERNRINAALAQLISRGRAVGVVIVAALQDPRKEIIPFRNLIPTRIALSLVEPDETDLVLGKGARDKGADCSRIPLRSGIGWVWCDGEAEPTRVRASWVTDDDIAAAAAAYTPRTPSGDDDLTVIDLTDDKTRRRS